MNQAFSVYIIGYETGLPYFVGRVSTKEAAEALGKSRLSQAFRSFKIRNI